MSVILTVDSLLTHNQADEIIEQMEQDPLAKIPVETENSLYSRVYLPLPELSQEIWQKIEADVKQQFPQWPELCYVRPVWAVTKYQSGGHLGLHVDGGNRGRGWQSRLTVTIYLNQSPESFTGGSTCFYGDCEGNKIIREVQPRIGRAAIFPQDLYHSGETILGGIKYIMRSDIMERISTPNDKPVRIKTIRLTLNET